MRHVETSSRIEQGDRSASRRRGEQRQRAHPQRCLARCHRGVQPPPSLPPACVAPRPFAPLPTFLSSGTYAGRLRIIGPTARGRLLTAILAPRGRGVFYPVTARPASRDERRLYNQQSGGGTP